MLQTENIFSKKLEILHLLLQKGSKIYNFLHFEAEKSKNAQYCCKLFVIRILIYKWLIKVSFMVFKR